jgi:hypothetical protein
MKRPSINKLIQLATERCFTNIRICNAIPVLIHASPNHSVCLSNCKLTHASRLKMVKRKRDVNENAPILNSVTTEQLPEFLQDQPDCMEPTMKEVPRTHGEVFWSSRERAPAWNLRVLLYDEHELPTGKVKTYTFSLAKYTSKEAARAALDVQKASLLAQHVIPTFRCPVPITEIGKTVPLLVKQFLAGFFDGDGSIGIYRDRNGFRVSVSVSQSQNNEFPRILRIFHHYYGGSICSKAQRANRPAMRREHRWMVCGAEAQVILQDLLKHAALKHEQAAVALQLLLDLKLSRRTSSKRQKN